MSSLRSLNRSIIILFRCLTCYLPLLQETKHPLLLIHPLGHIHTALQTNARVNRVNGSDDRLIVPMAAQVEDGAELGAEAVPERCCEWRGGRGEKEGGRREEGGKGS